MTDKQIIDGVDVSGCPHYQTIGYLSQKDEGVEDYCNLFAYSCKNVNCHYKKWQRKEQECERLNKIIDEAKNSKLDLKSFLVCEAIQNEYEEQLDQLKTKNSILEDEYKILEDNLDSRTRDFEDVIDRYKQTLTEIKDIAERCGKRIPLFEIDEIAEDLKQILQKISEVEDVNI